jgi:predicted ATP-grasp superfamily ATP-dependent carboligase
VYAVTESRVTPAALSRYLRGRVVWPTTGLEDASELVAGLLAVGRDLKRLSRHAGRAHQVIALPTDDEAALLLGEHAGELGECFRIPAVPPCLPRSLAAKDTLAELCATHHIPCPASFLPASVEQMVQSAATIGYPVVVKNARPWQRLRHPGVGSSTVVADEAALRRLARAWVDMPSVLVQELVAGGAGADWIVNVYCDAESRSVVCFTGVKVRCWPPGGGVGSLLYAKPNDAIAEMTAELCRKVGYQGVADLDWRLDGASGTYKLLDFNPRLGAQAQLFRNDQDIDVARALHLDLTGRSVPCGRQLYDRGLRVEHLDVPAMVSSWHSGHWRLPVHVPRGHTALAWLAPADPVPAVAAAALAARPAFAMATRGLKARRARRARRAGTGR